MGPKLKKFFKIPLILLCLAVPVAGWIWCGEGGMVRLCRTEVERRACLDRIQKLVAENQALFDEVHRLRTDMTYVEFVARTELNLIRGKRGDLPFWERRVTLKGPVADLEVAMGVGGTK